MSNLRRVFFTWNNWAESFDSREAVQEHFAALPHLKGAVVGFEVGESGTPHLQGVVGFTQPKTFMTLRKYLKNNHLEKIRSLGASIEYCKKEGDYFELGELKEERARTDLEDFKAAILEGRETLQLFEEYPAEMLRYYRAAESLRFEALQGESKSKKRDVKAVYLGGESGVGNTKAIWAKAVKGEYWPRTMVSAAVQYDLRSAVVEEIDEFTPVLHTGFLRMKSLPLNAYDTFEDVALITDHLECEYCGLGYRKKYASHEPHDHPVQRKPSPAAA